MNTLVVLFAVVSVACGSVVQLAQPAHHPALVLDPHGRPLDTAEVIHARNVHLQAKALEHAAPLAAVSYWGAHSSPLLAHSSPLLAHSALHLLKKRSLVAYTAPSAVSHQSRVDVISSPSVLSHSAVLSPVLSHAAVAVAPAAVSHQSRVDVRTSPALVSHAYAAPALAYSHPVLAHAAPLSYSVLASPYAHSALSHGHYLKKRSLATYLGAWSHAAPAAVSHQSRVDVHTSPAIVSHAVAAPLVSHAVVAAPAVYAAPAAVSHQSRVDVRTSPALVSHAYAAPLAHTYIASPYAHSGLHASPLVHAW